MRQLDQPKKIRSFIAIITILIVVGVFYFWNHQQKATSVDTPAEKSQKTDAAANASQTLVATSSQDTTLRAAAPIETVHAMNEPEFQNWVQQESKSLNSTNVNTEEKEIQIRALSKTLTATQNRKLIEITGNTEADVNARILSAYLLTLNPQAENQTYLVEIAKKALPDLGPINSHSVAEVKRAQELSLRMMAIDELAIRAKTDPMAAQKLQLLSVEAESAEVRGYALRKFKELK